MIWCIIKTGRGELSVLQRTIKSRGPSACNLCTLLDALMASSESKDVMSVAVEGLKRRTHSVEAEAAMLSQASFLVRKTTEAKALSPRHQKVSESRTEFHFTT